MSLIATASPWNSSDSTKKRIPTMRKTMKKMPTLEKDLENTEVDEISGERPTSFLEDQTINDERSDRVNKLLNNMSSVLEENEAMVKDYKSAKDRLFGFFVGQVMKLSRGKANPQMVNKILMKKLKQ